MDGVISTLFERNLIRAVARKDVPGRPFLYGTTPEFLQLFNLKDLTHLPTLKEMEEIRLAGNTRRENSARKCRRVLGRDGTFTENTLPGGLGFASRSGTMDSRRTGIRQRHGHSKLGSQADPAKDSIKVDGKRIKPPAAPLYFAFHKPPGVITTLNDPQKRPDLTPVHRKTGKKQRVFPVGRLDYNSTGLLLLTNDGDLAGRLTHPRFGVKKVYQRKTERLPNGGTILPSAQGHSPGGRNHGSRASARIGETKKKCLGGD